MTEMVRAVLNGDYEIVLPAHRAERPEWYTEAGWERARLAALRDIIRSQTDPVVYYVGAEEGEMAALCQMWGAEVVLFEPNPKAWPNIKAIWQANELAPPLACLPGFASNVSRDIESVYAKFGSFPTCADDKIVGDHGFKELYLEGDNYPQYRIDDLVDPRPSFSIPSVITFDCEGSEWQVMRGAELTVRTYKPTIVASIHPEFMFHQWGEYSRDFRDWIIALGYTETILEYAHELHCLYEPTA